MNKSTKILGAGIILILAFIVSAMIVVRVRVDHLVAAHKSELTAPIPDEVWKKMNLEQRKTLDRMGVKSPAL
ncbi:hypothetical protein KKF84_01865 [Myxococcota bacterium]|nr:hypothetical protein [Myxococcota bacterium]MBU1534032.1 hypothetical protein [Myxococcota bacterium]